MSEELIPFDPSIAIYAFRYCLGRKTYAVSECVKYLTNHWDKICKTDRHLIHNEIREAIDKNDIGMDMDRQEWEKILSLELDDNDHMLLKADGFDDAIVGVCRTKG